MGTSKAGGHGEVVISPEVQEALLSKEPVVALESALITHGLPFPRNVEVARQMVSSVSGEGATAATVAVIDGRIHVGLTDAQIQVLAESRSSRKVGVRDFALASVQRSSGGTTVAATIFAANRAGMRVFATGGIGGVHREYAFDVSADLAALAHTPIIVVCAGAKAILDLRATLEYLETLNVPVLGYGTDDFPAFYSRTSGLKAGGRLDSPQEVAKYWAAHCALGMRSAVLVANPIPEASAIPRSEMEGLITQASREALEQGIHGQALTPFLLKRLGELSDRRTIEANVALLVNNARLAAQIAVAVVHQEKSKERPT